MIAIAAITYGVPIEDIEIVGSHIPVRIRSCSNDLLNVEGSKEYMTEYPKVQVPGPIREILLE